MRQDQTLPSEFGGVRERRFGKVDLNSIKSQRKEIQLQILEEERLGLEGEEDGLWVDEEEGRGSRLIDLEKAGEELRS